MLYVLLLLNFAATLAVYGRPKRVHSSVMREVVVQNSGSDASAAARAAVRDWEWRSAR